MASIDASCRPLTACPSPQPHSSWVFVPAKVASRILQGEALSKQVIIIPEIARRHVDGDGPVPPIRTRLETWRPERRRNRSRPNPGHGFVVVVGVPAGAKPCAAICAARLGRSGGGHPDRVSPSQDPVWGLDALALPGTPKASFRQKKFLGGAELSSISGFGRGEKSGQSEFGGGKLTQNYIAFSLPRGG
jgi:hypothetical protein